MIAQVIVDLGPFLCTFLMFILLFTAITLIMESDYDDKDYSEVPKNFRILIQTFRNSIGDIEPQKYGEWGLNKNNDAEYNQAKNYA